MAARIFTVYGSAPGPESERAVRYCADIIAGGGIAAFPTETVYGIGCNGLDVAAVEKLYSAKMRPPVKPMSLCVASLAAAEEIAFFDERARRVFKAFLPGPLTLVLKRRECVPSVVTAGGDTVGIRVPAHPIALGIAEACGVPIALPSANISGMGAPTDGKRVIETLADRVDAIIDAGETAVGVESTILSLVAEPRIIRQGALPLSKLEEYF